MKWAKYVHLPHYESTEIPPVGLAPEQTMQAIRNAFEADTSKYRAGMIVVLKRNPETQKYYPLGFVSGAGLPPPIILLEGVNIAYRADPNSNGLVTVFDSWGYPKDFFDSLRKPLELARKATDPLQATHQLVQDLPQCRDYLEEDRTEHGVYTFAADNGDFLQARQQRGLEHHLHFAGDDPLTAQLLQWGVDPLAIRTREIVERI